MDRPKIPDPYVTSRNGKRRSVLLTSVLIHLLKLIYKSLVKTMSGINYDLRHSLQVCVHSIWRMETNTTGIGPSPSSTYLPRPFIYHHYIWSHYHRISFQAFEKNDLNCTPPPTRQSLSVAYLIWNSCSPQWRRSSFSLPPYKTRWRTSSHVYVSMLSRNVQIF